MPLFSIAFTVLGVLLILDATLRLVVSRFVPESTGVRIVECVAGLILSSLGGMVILGNILG